MKKIILFSLLTILTLSICYAQSNNGTVQSLVNAEKSFNLKVKQLGTNEAFLKVADTGCVIFRQNPIKATEYYSQKKQTYYTLSWEPEYAMISKAGDFGFTTGPYVFNDEKVEYGHYLSVWKSSNKKPWKLVLDAGISHKKPDSTLIKDFEDPENYKYPKLIGPQKIKWREEIVYNTDVLLGKSLRKSGNKNFYEFYAQNVRLYFPNFIPITGKSEVIQFLKTHQLEVISTPSFADRAFSGDLAYTYGKATISGKNFNYIRIWQIDGEKKWNIILDMYMP
ncbi:hypothetical protein N9R54_02090 [Pelobium sp.]|nr:hypothetical protein [Pelobium sp.]MDA9555002.1 hypothetical protein [Pelobium sp.]